MPPCGLVKRRDADQSVYAGFGSQQAVGVFAFNSERHTFQSGFLAWLILEHFGFEATLLGPLEIHAQQHLGPVLRLGAAGAGLDVDERVHRIHLAGEHALELQLADLRLELGQVIGHRLRGVVVAVGDRHFQQVAGVIQPGGQRVDAVDDGVQAGAFAAQFLRARRVVPHGGNFQFAGYFFKAFAFRSVVKDTP
jgi:hypothetical protein